MKVDITEFEKKYSFELESVTQLCGLNILRKTYMIESIKRYFSTYKYKEEKNCWRDNVQIDEENIGRKYFSIFAIKEKDDLVTQIKWNKQSILVEFVKQIMQQFDFQKHLREIDEELEKMFQIINNEVGYLGNIELTYDMDDVWNMVQKTNVMDQEQKAIDDKSNYELLEIFLNIIEKLMKIKSNKSIVIFENLDHMVSYDEYMRIIEHCKKIAYENSIYFLISTSIEGFVVFDKEICEGIAVIGEVDFQMPKYEELKYFIKNNYPCNKELSEQQIEKIIINIIQKIGQPKYLRKAEENVICKLLNQSMLLNEKLIEEVSSPEMAFLKA